MDDCRKYDLPEVQSDSGSSMNLKKNMTKSPKQSPKFV